MKIRTFYLVLYLAVLPFFAIAQNKQDSSLLSLDRIFTSSEFRQDYPRPIQWIDEGNAYVTIEKSEDLNNAMELRKHKRQTQDRSIFH